MKYTPALGAKLCSYIAQGSSLVKAAKKLDLDYNVAFDWIKKYPEFASNYANAREAQADYHADAIIEIADTEKDASKARNRIDARKWIAGKMKPKKYGEKQLGSADDPIHTIGVLKWKDE